MNNRKAKILMARMSVKIRAINISSTRYSCFYVTPWGDFIQTNAVKRKGNRQLARVMLQREGW